MKTYAIIRVYNYKGGELNVNSNLSFEELMENMAEHIMNGINIYPIEVRRAKNLTEDEFLQHVVEEVTKYLKVYSSIYAGSDRFCGEFYEIDNNRMRKIRLENYIVELSKKIIEFLSENESI
jgi:hypothetical protein